MLLLPPAKGLCPICATDHAPTNPHNAESLYYKYRFYGIRGRWPTWADAIAHCTEELQIAWKDALQHHGHWTEPDAGTTPIADPPHDAIRQPIGDLEARGFGPDLDSSLQ